MNTEADARSQPPIKVDTKAFFYTVVKAAVGTGLVTEEKVDFAKDRASKPLIVIAAAPKTGSTFLVNTLMQVTQLQGFRLCAAYSTNEHDLYLPALLLMNGCGCISQLHMKGTFHNAELMRTFGIKPIILTRRIDDIALSLMHDLKGKAEKSYVGTGRNGYSFIWQDQDTKDMSDERLLDMIVDLAMPWFVNFYVSWYRLCEQGSVNALWVTYEELFADKEKAVRKALRFLGLAHDMPIDPEILSRKYFQFRDGRIGQGASILSPEQRARLRRLFSYYPGVDFAKYGL
jgi:hypothetical protein